jgi:hypothetical protein
MGIRVSPFVGLRPRRNTVENLKAEAEEVRRLLREGHDVYQVAVILGRSREFVRKHAGELFRGRAPVFIKPKKRHKYDWLPEDDEANRVGYWVPTPEELRLRMNEVRYGEFYRVTYLPKGEKIPAVWCDHALSESVVLQRFRSEIGVDVQVLQVRIAPKLLTVR